MRPAPEARRTAPSTVAIVPILLVGLLFVAAGCLLAQDRAGPSPSAASSSSSAAGYDRAPIAGVSLVAPRRPTPAERLAPLAEPGAGWVAVIPYAFVRPDGSSEVHFDVDGQFWGERSEGVRRQVEQARVHGMKVLLKPHLWVRGDGWAGEFAPSTEEGWQTFESSYRAYVLGVARLAEELGVEMLCVGTEMSLLVAERPELFRRLIARVREVYGGPLTYAANWDAYADVPFWADLDYIGVDAYFPLSSDPRPTVEALETAWVPRVAELRAVSRRHDRPVLFTEFGYRALPGAAGEQWTLPDVRRTDPGRGDPVVQARVYEALFRSWWDEPWFAGGFLWKWYLTELDGRRGRRIVASGYTPQGKGTVGVIRRWYGASRPGADAVALPAERPKRS